MIYRTTVLYSTPYHRIFQLLVFSFFCVPISVFAQTAVDKLVQSGRIAPGRTSRVEVQVILGQPVSELSKTLSEYRAPASEGGAGEKIYVQYGSSSDAAERIEVALPKPLSRADALNVLGLSPAAASSKVNARGKLEEYFSAQTPIVLTHSGAEAETPVTRVAYYSPKLFASAVGKSAESTGATTGAIAVATAVNVPGSSDPGADLVLSDLKIAYNEPGKPALSVNYVTKGKQLDFANVNCHFEYDCGSLAVVLEASGLDISPANATSGIVTLKPRLKTGQPANGKCQLLFYIEEAGGRRSNSISTSAPIAFS